MGVTRRMDISILKGIGILLVVVGHAGAPAWMNRIIYDFHMPLFFMASGYFFSPEKAERPWDFLGQRMKGLYLPFLKWGLLFLLLHNLLHTVGILTTLSDKGMYSLADMVRRAGMMLFTMSGYEPHILGAAWFFRALLLSSVLFMGMFCLLRDGFHIKRPVVNVGVILCFMLLLTAYLRAAQIRLVVPQGGYRECVGIIFFALGYLFRVYEHRLTLSPWATLSGFLVLGIYAQYFSVSLSPSSSLHDFLLLLFPGVLGWTATFGLSRFLQSARWAKGLAYLGEHSLIILLLHFLAFKVANIVKIVWLDLDWSEMGRHVMAAGSLTGGWVLYSFVGVVIPLLVEKGMDWMKHKVRRRADEAVG